MCRVIFWDVAASRSPGHLQDKRPQGAPSRLQPRSIECTGSRSNRSGKLCPGRGPTREPLRSHPETYTRFSVGADAGGDNQTGGSHQNQSKLGSIGVEAGPKKSRFYPCFRGDGRFPLSPYPQPKPRLLASRSASELNSARYSAGRAATGIGCALSRFKALISRVSFTVVSVPPRAQYHPVSDS